MYKPDDLVEACICGLRIRFRIETSCIENSMGKGHYGFNPLCGRVFLTTKEIVGFYVEN